MKKVYSFGLLFVFLDLSLDVYVYVGSIIIVEDSSSEYGAVACSDIGTVCPGSSDQIYIVTYYIKSVTTSWTHSRSVYDAIPANPALFVRY